MAKTISVYLNDGEIATLDRMARSERRSRSAMLGEVIRRYAGSGRRRRPEQHPFFRDFTHRELDGFLKEDAKVPPRTIRSARKRLGLE